MELSSPTIGQQVKRIYEDGLRHIIVVPLFFVNGKHMQIDVPAQIQESAAKYNDLTIATESPLLESEQFIEFMRDQLRALNQSWKIGLLTNTESDVTTTGRRHNVS